MIGSSRIEAVEIEYSGGLFEKQVAPVTVALQKGLLTPALADSVNYVNAPFYVQQRGIRVTETRTSSHDVYSNLITARLYTSAGVRVVSGTVFGAQQRIVMIDNYHCTVAPEGAMLLVFNDDRPGAIGLIGTLLGRYGINIADMSVGRAERGGQAVMLINIDGVVTDKILTEIGEQPGIRAVSYVVLPE